MILTVSAAAQRKVATNFIILLFFLRCFDCRRQSWTGRVCLIIATLSSKCKSGRRRIWWGIPNLERNSLPCAGVDQWVDLFGRARSGFEPYLNLRTNLTWWTQLRVNEQQCADPWLQFITFGNFPTSTHKCPSIVDRSYSHGKTLPSKRGMVNQNL